MANIKEEQVIQRIEIKHWIYFPSAYITILRIIKKFNQKNPEKKAFYVSKKDYYSFRKYKIFWVLREKML